MTARAILLSALLLGGPLFWPAGARAQVPAYDTCDAEVAEALWDVKIETSRVRSIYISPRLDIGRSRTYVAGLQVWVRLADCKGALVLDLTPDCRVQQIYSRGECQVEGVARF